MSQLVLPFIIGLGINLIPFGLLHLLEGKRRESQPDNLLLIFVYLIAALNLTLGMIWIPDYLNDLSLRTYCSVITGSIVAPAITYFSLVKKQMPGRDSIFKLVFGIASMFVCLIGLSGPLAIYFIATGIGLDGKADNLGPGIFLIAIGGSIGAFFSIRLYLYLCKKWNIDPGAEFDE